MQREIFVNGRFLTQPVTGVQRYAHELLRSLDKLLSIGSLTRVPTTVLVPHSTDKIPDYSFLKVKRAGQMNGQAWEQLTLPSYCRRGLLFTPCGGAPLVHSHHVVTIHDAGPFRTPGSYTFIYRAYYRSLQKLLARRSTSVITVSEFSRRELAHFLEIPADRILVSYESGEHVLRFKAAPEILAKHGLTAGRYALGVSSANPNKNLKGLMTAASLLGPSQIQIAITGGANSSIFSSHPHLSDSVRQLGVVNDSELRSLYENAGCFVFPSFYEGFGLPPMEAMVLGCPVIVSRESALPEVFGRAATYCDARSSSDIAATIQQVIDGHHPSRELAMNHAANFSWERCARETWAILLRALEHPTSQRFEHRKSELGHEDHTLSA